MEWVHGGEEGRDTLKGNLNYWPWDSRYILYAYLQGTRQEWTNGHMGSFNVRDMVTVFFIKILNRK
jgi:hypothetical protein